MFYPSLTHRAFRNFNFSGIFDPSLGRGPSFETLFKLAYQARQGDRFAPHEFGDVMYFTLRPAAFEAYQRSQGPHAFTYTEWFYAKVMMFCEVLLYERLEISEWIEGEIRTREVEQPWAEGVRGFCHYGSYIDDEEIEQALVPEDNERLSWMSLVLEVSAAKTNRVKAMQQWLRRQPAERAAEARKASWSKNRDRDQTIVNCLERGMERADICKELDRLMVPTNQSLQKVGLQRWTDAWKDPDGRQTIQQLFSKLRSKRVKSRSISK
jgi:hypothetical protein